ncbi:MAG: peptidoglycan DD-metalloendopeptidase family protein [Microcoleaceae cyanobacterium]
MSLAEENQTAGLNSKKSGKSSQSSKNSIENFHNLTSLTNLTNNSEYLFNQKIHQTSNKQSKNSPTITKKTLLNSLKVNSPKITLSKLFILKLGLGLATLTLLGKGLAEAEEIFYVEEYPTVDQSQPVAPSIAPEPAPVEEYSNYSEPEVYTAPFQDNYQGDITAPPPSSEPSYFQPEPLYIPEEQYVSPPFEQVETPPIAPVEELPPVTLPNWQETPNSNYADNYIDQTPYEVGATDAYEAPDAIIFTERGTGCENGSCDTPVQTAEITPPANNPTNNYAGTPANNSANNNYAGISENNPDNNYANTVTIPLNSYGQSGSNPLAIQPSASNSNNWVAEPARQNYQAETNTETNIYEPVYSANSDNNYYDDQQNQGYYSPSGNTASSEQVAIASVLPAQVSGLFDVNLMMDSGLSYYNRTQRPRPVANNGNTSLLFPLSLPAPITSTFGWRQHPVLGYSRFHTGTDLGAEQGTPVVAVLAGRVTIADWLGGYGITVVLAHEKTKSESLYGHLSEIFVKPGEWVQQGEVIGRVGSTGMSTGPHLHFEMRQLTKDGWVTKSADEKITNGLSDLLKILKIDKLPTLPKIALNDLKKQTMDGEGMPKLPPLPPGFAVAIPDLEPPYPELMKPMKPQPNRPNNKPVISQKNQP